MKYDIQELLTKVDRLENSRESHLFTETNNISNHTDSVLWDFPITTLDEVALFENKLQDKTFRSKIVII